MALTKAHNRMIAGSPTNVLDFGATGNGTTDDTAAIQAAATSLSSGGTLIFPTGTYLVSSSITLPDNVSVIGQTGGSTITCASMSGGAFGAIVAGANSIIEKMKFSGVSEDEAGGCAIEINGKDGVWVNDCIITGFGESIIVFDADDFSITSNRLSNCGRWSIIFAKATNGLISNNIIKDAQLYDGIKGNGNIYGDATLYEVSNIIIDSNVISGSNRDGIDVASDSDSITISNNHITSCTLNGIEVKLLSGATAATRYNIIGNKIFTTGTAGIRIDDITDSRVSDNIIDSSSTDGLLCDYSENIDITDNIVRNCNDDGIRIKGLSGNQSKYFNVIGNKCINNGNGADNGIDIGEYTSYIVVRENYCYQNDSSKTNVGIKVTGTASDCIYVNIEDNYCPNSLTVSGIGISLGTHTGDNITIGNNTMSEAHVVVFADGATSPSIAGCNSLYQTSNTSATSITSFDNGSYEMKPFTIFFNDSNTTIVHGSGLKLAGAANKTFSGNSTLTLMRRNNVFYEVARQET